MTQIHTRAFVFAVAMFLAAFCGAGCSTCQSFHARYRGPDYIVTSDFYAEAPQKTAILPFASRSDRKGAQEKADICRKVFYQQFSVREFDDLEMTTCDKALLEKGNESGKKRKFAIFRTLQKLDAVGMTSLLDLHTIVTGDPLDRTDITELFQVTRESLPVDATIAGVTRSYGRFYAVVFSTIRLGTRVEMRSSQTGKLLWRGQHGDSNYVFPVSLNPIDIPYLLFFVWHNSRGAAMDMLAYNVYGDLAATIPYVPEPVEMLVRTKRDSTPYYKKPRLLMFLKRGKMPAGLNLTFLMEKDGWFRCQRPTGEECWILKRHAELNPRPRKLVASDAVVESLCTGFKFVEGPAADADGNIYFSDIPSRRIHKWSVEGRLSTVRENTGRANGLTFDHKGNLLACEGALETAALTTMSRRGTVRTIVKSFNEKPFNSPNDLWIAPDRSIYFTDPRYGKNRDLPQGGEHVYHLARNRKKLIRVTDDLVRPNGIVGTRDGRLLYVADHGDGKIYRYRIGKAGELTDKTLFCEQGSDGMALDELGNLYLTTDKVRIFSPDGREVRAVAVPERPANVTFGGKDGQTLFITARTSLYAIRMNVRGQ